MQECFTYDSCCTLHGRLGQIFFFPSFTPSIFIIAFITSQLSWKSEMTLKLPFIPHILIFTFHPDSNQAALHFFNDLKKKKKDPKPPPCWAPENSVILPSVYNPLRHVRLHLSDETRALCLEVNKLASGPSEAERRASERANAGCLHVVTNPGEASVLCDVTERLQLENNTANVSWKTRRGRARGRTPCLLTDLESVVGKRRESLWDVDCKCPVLKKNLTPPPPMLLKVIRQRPDSPALFPAAAGESLCSAGAHYV